MFKGVDAYWDTYNTFSFNNLILNTFNLFTNLITIGVGNCALAILYFVGA